MGHPGRLLNANCGSAWSQSFSYDQYGNLTKSGSLAWNPGYYATSNHYMLAGTSYDSDGNLLNDTFHTYTWNFHGYPATIDTTTCGTGGTCATYDANGQLVEKNVSGVYSQVLYSPVGKLAIMNGQIPILARFPMPGGATYYQAGSTGGDKHFWHKDWLGNVRLSTTLSSRASIFDRAFAPFGETYNNFGNTTNNDFTGDTQDTITGTYDTPNRLLNPNQGRWISADPAGLQAVNLMNPQSWNRYAYVLNDPLSSVDPLGLDCIYDNGDGTATVKSGDCLDPNDKGYYVDGTIDTTSVFSVDREGELSFGYTDANGNYGTYGINDYEDPQPTQDSFDPLTPSPSAQDAMRAIAGVLNNKFPTVCKYSFSARLSAGDLGVGVTDTQSGTNLAFGPSFTGSNYVRGPVTINTNLDPGASIRIGTPAYGLAFNPTNGQIGAYLGRSITLFGKTVNATLTTTVGKIGTNTTCSGSSSSGYTP